MDKIKTLILGYQKFQVLSCAIKLFLFDEFEKPNKPKYILSKEKSLFNLLEIWGFLKKTEDSKYVNSEISSKYFVSSSDKYLGDYILHHHNCYNLWSGFTKSYCNNKPVLKDSHDIDYLPLLKSLSDFSDKDEMKKYLDKEKINVSGKKLLDLGGGLGSYSIIFKDLGAEVTYFDQRDIVSDAAKNLYSKNIEIITGDFTKVLPIKKFDIIFLSEVIHGKGEEELCDLFFRLRRNLKQDGILLIRDFMISNEEFYLFDLHMGICTRNGKVYDYPLLVKILKNAEYKRASKPYKLSRGQIINVRK